MKDSLIAKFESQLGELEKAVEELGSKVGDKVELSAIREQRAKLGQILSEIGRTRPERVDVLRMGLESAWAELRTAVDTDAIRATGGDRIDVLRMGLESAWAELRAAVQTATSTTSTASPESRDERAEPRSGKRRVA